jgi:hypothetical protein
MYSAIFECQARIPQQANIEGAGIKWDRRREERGKIIEFVIYDWVRHDRLGIGEVGVEDKDMELIDKGNNVRYLRMNWIDDMIECQVQIENHMLLRKLSRDNQNPEGTILNVSKIRYINSGV